MGYDVRKKLLEAFDQLSITGKKIALFEVTSILSKEQEALKRFYDSPTIPKAEPQSDHFNFENSLAIAAMNLAFEYEQISISMLQRRLGIRYFEAAQIVDELEMNHFISPASGSKPRELLITKEEFDSMQANYKAEQ